MSYLLTWAKQIFCFRLSCIVSSVVLKLLALKKWENQPRPQGLLIDHFENRHGEGSGDEVVGK